MVGLVIAALALWQLQPSGAGLVSAHSGADTAPEFHLESLEGLDFRLADFEGRILVLEFWATWCGPCRLQAEILADLYGDVGGSDVEFLAIDLGEARDTVEAFVREDPFPYPVLLDPNETQGISYGIYALPTVVVIDPHGQVRFTQPGITDRRTLEKVIVELRSEMSS